MVKKLDKGDKKFLINLNLSNRDYLTNCANMLMSFLLGFSAIMVAIYSIYVSWIGLNKNSLVVGLIFLLALTPYWIWSLYQYKKAIKNSKVFNGQYQKYLFEVYPQAKKEYH